jgi:alpha-N-acetylglucosamine transferase
MINLKNPCHILFNKIEIINYYLNLYDRIIYLDDTCIVSPNTPNLFDLVSENKPGTYIESKHFFRKGGRGLGSWSINQLKMPIIIIQNKKITIN